MSTQLSPRSDRSPRAGRPGPPDRTDRSDRADRAEWDPPAGQERHPGCAHPPAQGPGACPGCARLARLGRHPNVTRVPAGVAAPAPAHLPEQPARRAWPPGRPAPGRARRGPRGVERHAQRPGRWERPPRPGAGRARGGGRRPSQPVGACAGAQLLGISAARFSRLARGGCFSPCEFLLTEHGVIAWRYPPAELLLFAGRRPGLLAGRLPEGLRQALGRGQDWRPRRWRAQRTGVLVGRAPGPWEAAAVPAAVLPPAVLATAVPNPAERATLGRLRPALVAARLAAGPWRSVRRLLEAGEPDETGWYREQLAATLRVAREQPPPALTAGPRPSP